MLKVSFNVFLEFLLGNILGVPYFNEYDCDF